VSQTKWTPGPGCVRQRPTDDGLAVIEDGRQHGLFPITCEWHEAPLVAAAPELYEAGLEALPVIDAYLIRFPHSKSAKRVREMLSGAMAKARGEQP